MSNELMAMQKINVCRQYKGARTFPFIQTRKKVYGSVSNSHRKWKTLMTGIRVKIFVVYGDSTFQFSIKLAVFQ